MAIDYNSGSGIFDKLGALIRVINSFETFETGTHQTKLSAILAKLESANAYDDQARALFYQIDAEQKQIFRNWKEDMATLVQPLLTQEMYDGESYYSEDINDLLRFLIFCMTRDSASVDGTTITLSGPTAGASPAPTGNFSVVASKYFPNVQGADTSSQQNGIIWDNTYRIVCSSIAVSGAEQFRVEGDLVLGGRSHPSFMNAGNAGTLTAISSASNTLLNNGGFENLNPTSDMFAGWTLNTGTYTTDVVRDATPYRGTYACKFVNSAKFTQTMPVGTLQPYTKYLISLKAKKASSGDGTMNIGFTGTTGFYWTLAASSLTTSYAHYYTFFNTGANPSAIVAFICERTGSTTGNVFIDEVCLTPVPLIHGLGLAVISGSTDPAIDDYWTVRPQNNGEGIFMNFFGRWFDTLIPGNTAGSETISDSLAS